MLTVPRRVLESVDTSGLRIVDPPCRSARSGCTWFGLARRGWAALTGVAEHIPAVSKNGDVAMPLDEAFEYYGTDRGGKHGHYVNSFATMSREHTLAYDSQSAAEKIRVLSVLVHSELRQFAGSRASLP